ncbi:MAG: Anti-sigma factor antagonist [Patescibacteria group bacterium]|nr:Anti-sigma factor antagonist [Patescibacteria group bacterium]
MAAHVGVTRSDVDGIATFTFLDQLEMQNYEESFEPLYRAAKEVGGIRGIILNLSHLTYINSTGIGFIASLYSDCEAAGKTMQLTGICEDVGDAISITGLGEIVPII